MAETTTAPSNKLVAFKGRAQKEFTRAYKRGLISDAAARKVKKKHSKFAKKASHNPPKPEAAQSSVLQTVSTPVAAAAGKIGQWIGKPQKPAAGTSATLGIRG